MKALLLMNRAFVTGGTGYIGAALVRRLVALGWEVHVLVRPSSNLKALEGVKSCIQFYEYDGTTDELQKIIKKASPQIVFHLASLFISQHMTENVEDLINSNVLFSAQLVEAMVVNKVKYFINTGTSWQYYRNSSYDPVNLYAATKQAFEDILKYYVETGNIKASTLTLFDTYGPNDPRMKLVGILWKSAIEKKQLLMSPGEQLIDLVYLDDVVEAFICAARNILSQDDSYQCYGVSSGNNISIKRLVSIFEEVTHTKLSVVWGGRPYRQRENMETWLNFQTPPNWKPRTNIREGIMKSKPEIPIS